MNRRTRRLPVLLSALMLIFAAALLLVAGVRRFGRNAYVGYLPAPLNAPAAEPDPWLHAVAKVKEDRGEPAGRQAKIDIPPQLKHYSDTRRFLAVQIAEVRQHNVRTPRDLVELAGMLQRGEMVSLEPVTENYVLFGVGGSADKEPFTRFENGKSVPLFNEVGLRQEYSRIAEERSSSDSALAKLRRELSALGKRERAKRAALQNEISREEKAAKVEDENKALLEHYYGSDSDRTKMFKDYEQIAILGHTQPGRDLDIQSPAARRDLKVRLLSSLRPEALRVLDEIATSYREEFSRPLPVTSLVRPDEYQLRLSKTNPNATKIQTPPHSTGLAFDIFYGYMSAAEQTYLMSELARLKDAGRIEVLRENRDHYHVFAFVDGAKPNESLISASLGAAKPKAEIHTHHATYHAADKRKSLKAAATSRLTPSKRKSRRR